jgi:aldehyde dehydrogenase (NAD+)
MLTVLTVLTKNLYSFLFTLFEHQPSTHSIIIMSIRSTVASRRIILQRTGRRLLTSSNINNNVNNLAGQLHDDDDVIQSKNNHVHETSLEEIQRIFALQQAHQYQIGSSTVEDRRAQLQVLHDTVWSHRHDIQHASYQDKGNHPVEVNGTELLAVLQEISHTQKYLKQWTAPQPVSTPLTLFGTSSYIHHEPKGVCLIMSPWNFPFTLTLGPLVSAVAAGNTCMVKPSELSPHCSAVLQDIIQKVFVQDDESHVAVIQGGIATSTRLLQQPFHHMFVTASPALGKVVMHAAAQHLSSVTLELGGKSPVIVDNNNNNESSIATAARRLAWSKTVNCGQICIAPDYVWVHEAVKDEFLQQFQQCLLEMYGANPQQSTSYARIINQRHHRRLQTALDDAIQRGAVVEMGGRSDASTLYFEPTVVSNLDPDSILMTDEIFGPILPVMTFTETSHCTTSKPTKSHWRCIFIPIMLTMSIIGCNILAPVPLASIIPSCNTTIPTCPLGGATIPAWASRTDTLAFWNFATNGPY